MDEIVKLSDEFIERYRANIPHSILDKKAAAYLNNKEAPKHMIIAYYRIVCCKDYKEVMRNEFPFLKDLK